MLIDTHSHLYDEAFDADRAEAVARATAAGVGKILLPAIDSSTHRAMLSMAARYPDICFPLIGLHPTSVNDNPRWREDLDAVRRWLEDGTVKFYGIGEVGMDLYWSRDFEKEQKEAFRAQIELSLEYRLPLVIHTREAWPRMREIIGSYGGRGIRGVLHSFSGTLDDYRYFCGCGDWLFGIGGPVTYKNSALAEIVPQMDPDRIVLETDSPYLPPVPHRGKRNESSYIVLIRDKVAELTGRTPAEVERTTTANALRMFSLV